YYVLVRPDALDNVFAGPDKAGDQGASQGVVRVDTPALVPGVPQAVPAGGGAQLFQVQVPAGATLRLSLRARPRPHAPAPGGAGADAEVLVRAGDVPGDEASDATSFGTPAEAPFALVPTTAEGTYYVLVRGAFGPGAAPKVLAEFLPLSISDVATDAGGEGRY